jgi:hypothetical protein
MPPAEKSSLRSASFGNRVLQVQPYISHFSAPSFGFLNQKAGVFSLARIGDRRA